MKKEFVRQFEENEHDRFHQERVAERRRRNGFHNDEQPKQVVSDHVRGLIARWDALYA